MIYSDFNLFCIVGSFSATYKHLSSLLEQDQFLICILTPSTGVDILSGSPTKCLFLLNTDKSQ